MGCGVEPNSQDEAGRSFSARASGLTISPADYDGSGRSVMSDRPLSELQAGTRGAAVSFMPQVAEEPGAAAAARSGASAEPGRTAAATATSKPLASDDAVDC